MPDLVPVSSSMAGVVQTFEAATAGGDLCPQAKRILLLVVNAGATACNVTIHGQQAACGLPDAHDQVISVAAGASKTLGPYNKAIYNDAAGKLEIKYSQVTSVTIGAIEVGD